MGLQEIVEDQALFPCVQEGSVSLQRIRKAIFFTSLKAGIF
jgi:hypothetical protein